jgi:putative tricarboxylic transport membrane protein
MRAVAGWTVKLAAFIVGLNLGVLPAMAAGPEKTECIVGAKPGGGFDLTCRLAATALLNAKMIARPMQITYMEGGVGAVAMNHVVGSRPGEAGLITAASSGSALLLAQKKFGRHEAGAVRWVGAVGADYGAIFVKADSPIKDLKGLIAELKKDVTAVPVGGGGAVGSQDWMKVAIVAKAAGADAKKMRYVALEGGGAVLTNLQGGFIKLGSGDASELVPHMKSGRIRVLAVMSESRLTGDLKDVPTAREQGFDLVWPIWRGFYLGPKVSDADYQWWTQTFRSLAATPEFKKERESRGLFPFELYGKDFDTRVKADVKLFEQLAREAGLSN